MSIEFPYHFEWFVDVVCFCLKFNFVFVEFVWLFFFIFCRFNSPKGRIAVRTKTFEDPIEPQAHIFVKDKDPCIEIKDKTSCHDTMYDREKTWPKESLDRIK